METEEKLSVLVPVKMTETMAEDLRKSAGSLRKRPALVREFVAEGLARRLAGREIKVTREEARAIAEVKVYRGNPVAILRAAIPSLSAAQALNPEKR